MVKTAAKSKVLPSKPAKQLKFLNIIIPRPVFQNVNIRVRGLSPLLCHAWDAKVIEELRAKREGKEPIVTAESANGREIRDPQREMRAASYYLPDGKHGFPAGAFKKACVSATRLIDGLTMTQVQSLFRCPQGLVRLVNPNKGGGDWPELDTRMVRVGQGKPDVRHRPLFEQWECSLGVEFVKGATTVEQIGYLMMLAGRAIGVGEYRPERSGDYGCFEIV